jgi:hypothetical protein
VPRSAKPQCQAGVTGQAEDTESLCRQAARPPPLPAGRQMDASKTLADYNIPKESTIHVMARMNRSDPPLQQAAAGRSSTRSASASGGQSPNTDESAGSETQVVLHVLAPKGRRWGSCHCFTLKRCVIQLAVMNQLLSLALISVTSGAAAHVTTPHVGAQK